MGSAIFFCVLPLTLLDAGGGGRPFYRFGPTPQKNNGKVANLLLLFLIMNISSSHFLRLCIAFGSRKGTEEKNILIFIGGEFWAELEMKIGATFGMFTLFFLVKVSLLNWSH